MGKILKNNFFMLKYILKYTPGLIIFTFLRKIYVGLVRTFSSVYVAKFVLDSFQLGRSMRDIIIFLIIVVLANVLNAVQAAYYEESFFLKRKEILYRKMHSELFEKAKNMELACYDNPEFYNDFIWSINQSDGKAIEVLESFGKLIRWLTQIVSTAAIIISIHWSGIIVAVISGATSLIVANKANKMKYELSLEQNPLQRKRDYTSRVMYLSDYAKEIRLSNVKDKLIENFSTTNKSLIKKIQGYAKGLFGFDLIHVLGTGYLLMDGVYVFYLVYMILEKHSFFTYGGFMGLFQGALSLRDSLCQIAETVSSFLNNSLYIDKFRTFLDYEPKMEDGTISLPDSNTDVCIEFKHVTFYYDNVNEPTLKDINLVIHPNERLALVGYNGAGKTTLIKLLMRLYDPTEGSIELNGTDIREFKLKEYREYFGVVFQDFKLFAATVAENVVMDRVSEEDAAFVENALEKSDFTERLNSLEEGVFTLLTKEFSKKGVNLSGGESQKVAIARIFTGNSRVVVLDEPSSALDPVTEYNVNQSMLAAADNKAVVYISHRLSTTKMADKIYMLEKGQIIEEGNHDELMKINGKYAEMFNMQAEKYRECHELNQN